MNGITLPAAEDVDHDLIAAAQPMLLAGWTAPAVLTARVALERKLADLIVAAGIPPAEDGFYGAGRLSHALRARGVLGGHAHCEMVSLNEHLSQVAHGRPVKLRESVGLVKATEKRIRKLSEIRSRLLAL